MPGVLGAGIEAEWADIVRDLDRLRETVVEVQGKRFAVRTKPQGAVAAIVRCVGARLPPAIRLEESADAAGTGNGAESRRAA